MKDKQESGVVKGNPVSRRDFIKKAETVVAGGAIFGLSGAVLFRSKEDKETDYYWQIDHTKCIQCERCETECILPVSAVKCMHANLVCGYCDLCGGYYRTNVKDLNTAAENMICPTGAITRKFVEDPYFEYTIDENLCTGCAKCVKGCTSFGNGSLYLQINRTICVNCNECAISRACPSSAISRVSYSQAYNFKESYTE